MSIEDDIAAVLKAFKAFKAAKGPGPRQEHIIVVSPAEFARHKAAEAKAKADEIKRKRP